METIFDQIKEAAIVDELQKIADGDLGEMTGAGAGIGSLAGAIGGGIYGRHRVVKEMKGLKNLLRSARKGLGPMKGRLPTIRGKGPLGEGMLIGSLVGASLGAGIGAGGGATVGTLRQALTKTGGDISEGSGTGVMLGAGLGGVGGAAYGVHAVHSNVKGLKGAASTLNKQLNALKRVKGMGIPRKLKIPTIRGRGPLVGGAIAGAALGTALGAGLGAGIGAGAGAARRFYQPEYMYEKYESKDAIADDNRFEKVY